MMKALALAVFATATMNGFASQDPITTLPDSYAKQFENEWVRVVRVYYPPHAKLPAHAHNALPAAYVYLNDGIRFLAEDIPTGQPPMFQGGITDGDNAGGDNNAFN